MPESRRQVDPSRYVYPSRNRFRSWYVTLGADLADLCGVTTSNLNPSVRQKRERPAEQERDDRATTLCAVCVYGTRDGNVMLLVAMPARSAGECGDHADISALAGNARFTGRIAAQN